MSTINNPWYKQPPPTGSLATGGHPSPGVGDRRRQMYKHATPPWKDAYRKRCVDRLKSSRSKFLDKFRCLQNATEVDMEASSSSVVQDVMLDEWNVLRREQTGLPPLKQQDDSDNLDFLGEEHIDEVLSVFEEIRAELLLEEQQILAEYEAGIFYDEQSLSASLKNLSQEHVICPLCQKNELMLNRGIILCACGARIDTEQDCVTLGNVQESLTQGTTAHSGQCQEKPHFSVINQMGIDNLLMTCQVCDYMFIVV